MKFPNVRFQATSRLEVSEAMVTFMFQTHKMSLNVHPHVTFLFNFFMALRTTPQHGCITLGHRFIHQTLQLCIKFCKKIFLLTSNLVSGLKVRLRHTEQSSIRNQKSILSSHQTPTFNILSCCVLFQSSPLFPSQPGASRSPLSS